jgi:hypothetical protein
VVVVVVVTMPRPSPISGWRGLRAVDPGGAEVPGRGGPPHRRGPRPGVLGQGCTGHAGGRPEARLQACAVLSHRGAARAVRQGSATSAAAPRWLAQWLMTIRPPKSSGAGPQREKSARHLIGRNVAETARMRDRLDKERGRRVREWTQWPRIRGSRRQCEHLFESVAPQGPLTNGLKNVCSQNKLSHGS